jgi:hypothetical protein
MNRTDSFDGAASIGIYTPPARRNDEAAIARTNNLTEREYMQRRLDRLATA